MDTVDRDNLVSVVSFIFNDAESFEDILKIRGEIDKVVGSVESETYIEKFHKDEDN